MREEIKKIAAAIVERLSEQGCTVSTAESCTGGSIAGAITSIAGCSAVFKGSVVSYCNEIKADVLSVSKETLATHGAVSEETVKQMVTGVQRLMKTDYAVATSGIAGPTGGTPEKPVGTVWVAIAVGEKIYTSLLQLDDKGREANIENTVYRVLADLCVYISGSKQS